MGSGGPVPNKPLTSSEFSSLCGVLVQKQAFQKGDGSHSLLNEMFAVVVVSGC